MTEINPIISILPEPDCKNIPRKGEHVIRRVNKEGDEIIYRYAWRGGPRIREPGYEPKYWDQSDWRDFTGEVVRLTNAARMRAKQRGHEFTLTTEWMLARVSEQQNRCAITGLPFDLTNLKSDYTRNPNKPSIDRIDCKKGYTPENSRLVLLSVNLALNEWGLDNFLRIAEAALAKQKGAK